MRTTEPLFNGEPPLGGLTFLRVVLGRNAELDIQRLEVSDATPLQRLALVRNLLASKVVESTTQVLSESSAEVRNAATLRVNLKLSESSYLWRVLSMVLGVAVTESSEFKEVAQRMVKPLPFLRENPTDTKVSTLFDYLDKDNSPALYSDLHLRARASRSTRQLEVFRLMQADRQFEVSVEGIVSPEAKLSQLFQGKGYFVCSVENDQEEHVPYSLFFCLFDEDGVKSKMFRSMREKLQSQSVRLLTNDEYHVEGEVVWKRGRRRQPTKIVVFKTEPLVANLSTILRNQEPSSRLKKALFDCCFLVLNAVKDFRWRHNNVRCDRLVAARNLVKQEEDADESPDTWKIIDFEQESLRSTSTWLANAPLPGVDLPKVWDVICLMVDALSLNSHRFVVETFSEFSSLFDGHLRSFRIDDQSLTIRYKNSGDLVEHQFTAHIKAGNVVGEWRQEALVDFSLKDEKLKVAVSRLASYGVEEIFEQVKGVKKDSDDDAIYTIQYQGDVDNYLLIVFHGQSDDYGDRMTAHKYAAFNNLAVNIERLFTIDDTTFVVVFASRVFANEKLLQMFERATLSDLYELQAFIDSLFECVRRLHVETTCLLQNTNLGNFVVMKNGEVKFVNLRKAWHSVIFRGGRPFKNPKPVFPYTLEDDVHRQVKELIPRVRDPPYIFDFVYLYIDVFVALGNAKMRDDAKWEICEYLFRQTSRKYLNYMQPRSQVVSISHMLADRTDVSVEVKMRVKFKAPQTLGRWFVYTRKETEKAQRLKVFLI